MSQPGAMNLEALRLDLIGAYQFGSLTRDLVDDVVSALERAERVSLHAGRLVGRIDEFEKCLRDRGITQAPCHGIPLVGVFDVRDVLCAALAPAPEGGERFPEIVGDWNSPEDAAYDAPAPEGCDGQ